VVLEKLCGKDGFIRGRMMDGMACGFAAFCCT